MCFPSHDPQREAFRSYKHKVMGKMNIDDVIELKRLFDNIKKPSWIDRCLLRHTLNEAEKIHEVKLALRVS